MFQSLLGELAELGPLRIDTGGGAHQALDELSLGHLEGEERHGVAVQRDPLCDPEREGGLPDAGPGSEDHQVAGGDAAELAVEVGEAEPQSGEAGAFGVLECLDGVGEQRPDSPGAGTGLAGADLVHPLLGVVEDGGDLGGRIGGLATDLQGGSAEGAANRLVADDAGVELGVGGGRHVIEEPDELTDPAHALEHAGRPQPLADRHGIDRSVLLRTGR